MEESCECDELTSTICVTCIDLKGKISGHTLTSSSTGSCFSIDAFDVEGPDVLKAA
jgi:hypothetical protein